MYVKDGVKYFVVDGQDAFIGSQSLRQLELDARREIGLIFRDSSSVKQMVRVFEDDWKASTSEDWDREERTRKKAVQPPKVVKKIAKSVAKKVGLNPVAKKVAKVVAEVADIDLNDKKIHEAVKELVKDVVEETAEHAAKETVKVVAEAG